MSIQYIRNYYNVPARKGLKITIKGTQEDGVIAGASGPYIRVRLLSDMRVRLYHPDDIDYGGKQ